MQGLDRVAALSAADYLAHCEARVREEAARCADLLDPGTAAPLQAVVQAELVSPHFTALLGSGLPGMLEGARHGDLARLLRLASARRSLLL
jgi:Cullin family